MQNSEAAGASPRTSSRGFTLIELVTTLILIGVVAVVLLPRSGNDALVLSTQAEQLAGAIRYAQSAGMAKAGAGTSGRRYHINFTSTTYQFFYYDIAGAASTADSDPGSGSTGTVSLASGVTISIPGALTSNLICFNAVGTPYVNVTATTALAANADLVLSYGSASRTVRVFPETGMVRVL